MPFSNCVCCIEVVPDTLKDVMGGKAANVTIQLCPGFVLDFLYGSATNGDFLRL